MQKRETGLEGMVVVYRKSVLEPWHCSWCDFTHEYPDVVIDHENREHGGKKESK